MTDRRKQMLELVQEAHSKQTRNNGRVPYWMHLLSVAQILDWALDLTGENVDDSLSEDLYVAALGHDLYEDTTVARADIDRRFGARVDAWIAGMTNDGDHDRTAYLERLRAAPEEVRLLKLADITENTASVSYAIADMGVDWAEKTFLPIAVELRHLFRETRFRAYENTAGVLWSLFEYNYERLQRNIEMFRMAKPL